ncbi:pyruvate dehydrogenase E1 component subunit alpha, mitochondrial-like [Drosophila biarmipes]|uniref:pyruvate dehydrogenase E1 component subunit alpha, mitochondrial-like n=1 Tax=Drosophila biarmipes TaxID=125945 RepID=UPI0007E72AC2|nr:pyruvate dehydrogenase E1 component subunit alpha, mitochondrial-like [Drosophila biarmipes]
MFPAGLAFSLRFLRRGALSSSADLPHPLPPKESNEVPANNEPKQKGKGKGEPYEGPRFVGLRKGFKLHQLAAGPGMMVSLNKLEALWYHRQLLALRHLEMAASNLYKERLIRGFCHLYTGQEACAVGVRAAMGEQDKLISGYRIHGWAYMMGVSAQSVLAELTGRITGCSGGKGGSMHMYGKNFYGGTGIVGDQVPVGAGLAFAGKYLKDGAVSLAIYGDGAANQGQIFEAFNMAQLWKLPIIFVCENNNYGMGTSSNRSSSNNEYYRRGDLPGIQVDGQDVLAVRSATTFAIQHAKERGPLVLELKTYRYGGHSMSDPGTSYRSREEIQKVRLESDPIKSFQQVIMKEFNMAEAEIGELDTLVRIEIEEATKAARGAEVPSLPHLWSDVYSGHYEGPLRNVSEHSVKHINLHRKCDSRAKSES